MSINEVEWKAGPRQGPHPPVEAIAPGTVGTVAALAGRQRGPAQLSIAPSPRPDEFYPTDRIALHAHFKPEIWDMNGVGPCPEESQRLVISGRHDRFRRSSWKPYQSVYHRRTTGRSIPLTDHPDYDASGLDCQTTKPVRLVSV